MTARIKKSIYDVLDSAPPTGSARKEREKEKERPAGPGWRSPTLSRAQSWTWERVNTPSTCGVCVHLDLPAAPFRTPTSNGGVQTPKRSPSPHAPILKLVTRNHQVRGSPKTPVILQVEEPGAVCKEKKKTPVRFSSAYGPTQTRLRLAGSPAGRSVGRIIFFFTFMLVDPNK